MGSRRTTPTSPVAAAVVSEATEAPTNTPWVQSRASITRGATFALRPPKTMAEIGTPCGSSNFGEMLGHWLAGAVKRLLGCAAFSLLAGVQGLPRQSVAWAGGGERPSHQGCLSAVTEGGEPWWEGLSAPPARATDWKGQPWTPASKEKAAHPNSRFTSPASQCPSISPRFDDPQGVPLTAIIFGGRRARTAPLVFESFDWKHGTYVGAMVASETTAAATGAVGVVRRDPMAMLPFCGYNMGDYFGHWLKVGARSDKAPKIFHVNWFRTGKDGKFLWPGFGDNMRVLRWVLDRCAGKDNAVSTPIGRVPEPGTLDLAGLDIGKAALEELLDVDPEAWQAELAGQKEFLEKFGGRMPAEMWKQYHALEERLSVGAR